MAVTAQILASNFRSRRRSATPASVGRDSVVGLRAVVPVEQQRGPRRLTERRQGRRLPADGLPGEEHLALLGRVSAFPSRCFPPLSRSLRPSGAVVCPSLY